MSEVFESYERQYCEASASLARKCTAAASLQGGNPSASLAMMMSFFPRKKILGLLSLRDCLILVSFLRRKAEAKGGGDQIRHRGR
jgi:hypothetical protein